MRKTNAIVKIIVWSFVALFCLSLLIHGAVNGGFSFGWWNGKGEEVVIFEDKIPLNQVDSLDIKWTSGKVTVYKGTGDAVEIVETSHYAEKSKPAKISNRNGTLSIESNQQIGFLIFSFGVRSTNLQVKLPEKMYQQIVMKNTSGNIEFADISANAMTFQSSSGKLNLKNLTVNSMDVKITSGKITGENIAATKLDLKSTSGKADLAGAYQEIRCRSTSGTVTIHSALVPTALEAELTSGKMTFLIPENDGFQLRYKVTAGNLSSDFDYKRQDDASNKRSGTYIYKNGERRYSADVTSGTIRLEKR